MAVAPPSSLRGLTEPGLQAGWHFLRRELDREGAAEAGAAGLRHADRARPGSPLQPVEIKASLGDRRAERAGQMRAPLAPVQARLGEAAPLPRHPVDVDAESGKSRAAAICYVVIGGAALKVAVVHQRVGEGDAEPPRQM